MELTRCYFPLPLYSPDNPKRSEDECEEFKAKTLAKLFALINEGEFANILAVFQMGYGGYYSDAEFFISADRYTEYDKAMGDAKATLEELDKFFCNEELMSLIVGDTLFMKKDIMKFKVCPYDSAKLLELCEIMS